MEFLTDRLPGLIETFLAHFDDLFKNEIERRRARQYVVGLLMSGRNKTTTEMARHIVGANNQSLHHFLTRAPWDPDELNRRRVELLQRSRQTRFKPTGWFIALGPQRSKSLRSRAAPQLKSAERAVARSRSYTTTPGN